VPVLLDGLFPGIAHGLSRLRHPFSPLLTEILRVEYWNFSDITRFNNDRARQEL
jgi:hypothetical protein